jgi:hypothetical protein
LRTTGRVDEDFGGTSAPVVGSIDVWEMMFVRWAETAIVLSGEDANDTKARFRRVYRDEL